MINHCLLKRFMILGGGGLVILFILKKYDFERSELFYNIENPRKNHLVQN